MSYETFIQEICKYWDLRKRGLKKQANRFLFEFTKYFKENVSDAEADIILFQFCREYVDERKFTGDKASRHHLPFQLTELLNNYLNRACDRNQMPQMRWTYQIFGKSYNPHDPNLEHNPYHILERAYLHKECDQQTVDLYFAEQVELLWWGQHHFPEGCIITKETFEDTVHTANQILSEKSVDQQLVKAFVYYTKLYSIYFEWQENGKNGDFYELCKSNGLEYKGIPAIYYKR